MRGSPVAAPASTYLALPAGSMRAKPLLVVLSGAGADAYASIGRPVLTIDAALPVPAELPSICSRAGPMYCRHGSRSRPRIANGRTLTVRITANGNEWIELSAPAGLPVLSAGVGGFVMPIASRQASSPVTRRALAEGTALPSRRSQALAP